MSRFHFIVRYIDNGYVGSSIVSTRRKDSSERLVDLANKLGIPPKHIITVENML